MARIANFVPTSARCATGPAFLAPRLEMTFPAVTVRYEDGVCWRPVRRPDRAEEISQTMKAIATAFLVLSGASLVRSDDVVRYCATTEYVAVIGAGPVGQRLWVAPYPSGNGKPELRELVMDPPAIDLRCVGRLVYLHVGTKTLSVDTAAATTAAVESETSWEEIALNRA